MKVFTYKDQPSDNVDAWRLGEACRKAADDPKCGDYIDRGLILLRELQAKGYGIVRLPLNPAAGPQSEFMNAPWPPHVYPGRGF